MSNIVMEPSWDATAQRRDDGEKLVEINASVPAVNGGCEERIRDSQPASPIPVLGVPGHEPEEVVR